MCGYLTNWHTDPECFETYVGMSDILEWGEKEKASLKFKRADAMLVCSFDLKAFSFSCSVRIILAFSILMYLQYQHEHVI